RGHPNAARPRLQRHRASRGGRAGGGDLPPRQGRERGSDRGRPQPEHFLRGALVERLGRRLAARLLALQHPDRAVPTVMRLLAFLAALCCATGGAWAQVALPKKPAARQIDDSRARQALQAAQDALQRGDYAAAEAESLNLLQENTRTFGAD